MTIAKEQVHEWLFNAAGAIVDAAAIIAVGFLLWSLQAEAFPRWQNLDPPSRSFMLFFTPLLIAGIALAGGYRHSLRTPVSRRVVYAIKGGILSAVVVGVKLGLSGQAFPLGSPVAFGGLTFLGLVIAQLLLEPLRSKCAARGWGKSPTLLLGNTTAAQEIRRRLSVSEWLPYRLLAVLEPVAEPSQAVRNGGHLRLSPDEWDEALTQFRGAIVMMPMELDLSAYPANLLELCERHGLTVRRVATPSTLRVGEAQVQDLLGVPMIVKQRRMARVNERAKRVMDVALASLGLAALSPLFGVIAALIKLDSPGPVFYRQRRLTKHSRPFQMLKFRSMVADAEARRATLERSNEAVGPIFKIKRDPRVTKTGAFLRRTSLDELPQLINVLLGDLSLVGPRPPIPEEVARYQPWQLKRLEVKQGMTGLWQVSGRSELSFEEMVLLDLYYCEHWSLWFDLEILIETAPTVLLHKGAY